MLEQCRATQRYDSSDGGEEERLATQITELATRYGRYGYRRITAMLRQEGWQVDRSIDDTILPDCITLYKGPIKRACRTRAEMEAEVRDTVLHEIGHFFGLEESQLEEL